MPRQIQGSQTDFSFGEVDVALKRNDSHPARKGGLRQMANARILNAGGIQNRPGRSALYPVTNAGKRTERFTITVGNTFDIQFAAGRVKIINSAGVTVGNFTTQGGGGALPWASTADINSIVYAILQKSIYITFTGMKPQVITFDGVATWAIADYAELAISGQKRTFFYRLAPAGILMQPSGLSGAVTLTLDQPYFVNGHIGKLFRFCGRQVVITGLVSAQVAGAVVQEILPGSQSINLGATVDPSKIYSVGDVVTGTISGAKGYVAVVNAGLGANIGVQLLNSISSVPSAGTATRSSFNDGNPYSNPVQQTFGFVVTDIIVGPGGSGAATAVAAVGNPDPVPIWDEQVMDAYHGWPAACFTDQFRLGFCNFPAVPGGIGWSAINAPADLYVGANPSDAMFEIAPEKVRVLYVVPGPESSEFVFCDRKIYYIPISETNPLKPGSVAFKILSGDGAAQVQPRLAQEAILFSSAGQNSLMAIIATGAFLRPFNTKSLTSYHSHLFNSIQAIAAPSADASFEERYAYVLNGDGSVVVGKYNADSLAGNAPVVGWGPWSGTGVVSWVAAWAADVIFTSTYFGNGIVEILDDTQYLDGALSVNALPAAFTPPGGKGPLWFVATGQSVTLIDQVTRAMGTYVIDANGFIVPQFNGGEDLTLASLVAGQPWTMTTEPFAPIAQPGADVHQRMNMRQFSYFAVYVINSTGFLLQQLFSAKQTNTSPALGTPMNQYRVPMWNAGNDATKPPVQRETVESYPAPGSSFDPRVSIVKDTPGPLIIAEIAMEVSI